MYATVYGLPNVCQAKGSPNRLVFLEFYREAAAAAQQKGREIIPPFFLLCRQLLTSHQSLA